MASPAETSAFAIWKLPASGRTIRWMRPSASISAICRLRSCSRRFSVRKLPARPTVMTFAETPVATSIARPDQASSALITAGAPFGSSVVNSRILAAK